MKSVFRELAANLPVTEDIFILQFNWDASYVKAGQFFMLKPHRASVFLPRPISVFEYNAEQKVLKFLIAKRGRGTEELSLLQAGEKVRLTGPLGNCWSDFLPESGTVALVGGGIGVAPLVSLVAQKPDYNFHFYAGFKNGFIEKDAENAVLGHGANAKKIVIAAEDGRNALPGRVTDFIFGSENYAAVFACGPAPMLKALKKKYDEKNINCFFSMENNMACGVGACLGCTIKTVKGNRRCCKDGPIFDAREIVFDE